MAISTATLKYLIGISSEISSNVFYFDEQTILYPCGCYSVFFNTEQKTMRLLLASEKGAETTAMNLAPKHKYLAVALKSEKPSINVFNLFTLQKKRTLVCKELDSYTIVSLSFSSNSRYIVAICDDPSRTFLYWSWKRSKLLFSTKITVSLVPETLYHVSFNPRNYFNVYVFGNKFLKSFYFTGKYYKQYNFPKIEPQDFKCFCWDADQRLLVGTNTGRVLVIEDMDLRVDFNVFQYIKFSSQFMRSQGVTAIASYSKGFITACGTNCVQFFERVEENYKFIRDVLLPTDTLESNQLCDQIIQCMVVNPSNNLLVISTNMKQLYYTPINTSETKYMNQSNVFDILVHPFHYKSITGCCVCSWKPLIATSSLDGSIKLWNYETFTLELAKNFSEEVYSISMHPMGLFLLAGFSNKLCFFYILMDDLKPFKDLNIHMCTHCNFSRGGQMFAAANNNFIQVYSTNSFEMIVNLKGHNSKVQSTTWCMDDSHLISCGLDGAVYEWELKTGKHISQYEFKSCLYNSVTLNSNMTIYAVGSNPCIIEIDNSDILRSVPMDGILTSIALQWSNTMLFVGTNNGYIRSIEFPPNLNEKWQDYPCHSLETTHMIFTTNDQYLISTSKDASIAIWKINGSEDLNLKNTVLSESILFPKKDLKETNCLLSTLKFRTGELAKENEYKLHCQDTMYNDKIKDIYKTYTEEIGNLETRIKNLECDKCNEKSKHDEQMTKITENHCKEIENLNSVNEKKLLDEYDHFKYLSNKIMKLQEEHDQRVRELEEIEENLTTQLSEEYKMKCKNLEEQIYQCEEDTLVQQEEHNELHKLIEDDIDMETLSVKLDYEKQLYAKRHANSRMKDSNIVLKKKLACFPKELKEIEDECQKHQMEVKRLKIVKSTLENDIVIWKKEIEIQSQGLNDEEKRFCDLELKNRDLMELKYKLDLKKTIDLRKLLEVKETDISNMKKQITYMQSQLENFTTEFFKMDYTTTETKEKLAAVSLELHRVQSKLQRKTDLLHRFSSDLINLTSFIQDPQKLKNCIKSLYEKYINKDVDNIAASDPNIMREWSREQNHFERTIHKRKYKLNSNTKYLSQQNCHLINKGNRLSELLQLQRKENDNLLQILERN